MRASTPRHRASPDTRHALHAIQCTALAPDIFRHGSDLSRRRSRTPLIQINPATTHQAARVGDAVQGRRDSASSSIRWICAPMYIVPVHAARRAPSPARVRNAGAGPAMRSSAKLTGKRAPRPSRGPGQVLAASGPASVAPVRSRQDRLDGRLLQVGGDDRQLTRKLPTVGDWLWPRAAREKTLPRVCCATHGCHRNLKVNYGAPCCRSAAHSEHQHATGPYLPDDVADCLPIGGRVWNGQSAVQRLDRTRELQATMGCHEAARSRRTRAVGAAATDRLH